MKNTKQYIGKYEFPSKTEFDVAFSLLHQNDGTPKFDFSKPVKLSVPLTEAEFNEEGETISEATYKDTYNVDMSWWLKNVYKEVFIEDSEEMMRVLADPEHPEGWGEYALNVETEGLHSFKGVSYLKNKI